MLIFLEKMKRVIQKMIICAVYQMLYIVRSIIGSKTSSYSPIQSVYSFTSEILGVGATGPIRTVINR